MYNRRIMNWNIAQAKQQFSEVVRLSAQSPQAICNREKPVAVLVSAAEFENFQQWRTLQSEPSLIEQFREIRMALAQTDVDEGFVVSPRSAERTNAFLHMLEDEARH